MSTHRLAEERSLEYHRAIAVRLGDEPSIRDRARERVAGWLATGEVHRSYAEAWSRALAGPLDELCALLVAPSEGARALRQVSPFAGALSPRDRWGIWSEVRDRFKEER